MNQNMLYVFSLYILIEESTNVTRHKALISNLEQLSASPTSRHEHIPYTIGIESFGALSICSSYDSSVNLYTELSSYNNI